MSRLWRAWVWVWNNPITWLLFAVWAYFEEPKWVCLMAGFNFGCSLIIWSEGLDGKRRR